MLDFAARPLNIGFRVSVRGDRMADYYVDFLFSIAAQFHSCRLVILDLCWRSDWLAAGRTNRCFSVALMLPRRGGDTMKLTIRSAAQLALPAGKQDVIFWDDDIHGFGLRLRESGERSWVYRYRFGRTQRSIKLGNANSVSLTVARKNASQLEAEVRLGKDPAGQKAVAKQEAEHTFAAVAERFLNARKPELRPATLHEYGRHLQRDSKSLHRLPITAVTQADIARLLTTSDWAGLGID